MRRNLARFRLCSFPTCTKGAVIPKGRTKPNGWILTAQGSLYCPRHAHLPAMIEAYTRTK
jgi:hypothetical protein